MPHYHYKMRLVESVQVLDNGDVITCLACGHLLVWLGYFNTNDPNALVPITAEDAPATVGHLLHCRPCGGYFGDEQGIVLRHRVACGDDTLIPIWLSWSHRCAWCQ